MQFAIDLLQRRMKRHLERYDGVLVQLEEAFSNYEAKQTSINGYLETVQLIDQHFRRERAGWLRFCDWSLALRWINSAERRAFRETCDALDWCRNWAIRQRGVDVVTCLENVRETGEFDFVPALGVAA